MPQGVFSEAKLVLWSLFFASLVSLDARLCELFLMPVLETICPTREGGQNSHSDVFSFFIFLSRNHKDIFFPATCGDSLRTAQLPHIRFTLQELWGNR
jgi:hypothetical protein